MKRTVALGLLLCCLLAMPAQAEYKLEVTDQNWVSHGERFGGVYYATLKNTGTEPVGVNKGTIHLYDEDGNLSGEENYAVAYPSWARLEPGECCYVIDYFFNHELGAPGKVASYDLEVNMVTQTELCADITVEHCDVDAHLPALEEPSARTANGWQFGDDYVCVVATNNDDISRSCMMGYVIRDDTGNIVCAAFDHSAAIEVLPGSSVQIKFDPDRYWLSIAQENVTVISSVEGLVYWYND